MNRLIKYAKSNIGFIISLTFLILIAFNPKAKSLVLTGLMKTGLYEPDVSNLKPMTSSIQEQQAVVSVSSILFNSTDGKTIDLADLKGKVVFLNFWATWCPPCIVEIPSINSLYNKLKNNESVVFILADADNNLKRSEGFMKKNKYSLPVYATASSAPEQLFQGNLPTTIIINKKGEIVFNHEGMADYNSPEIEKLLNELSK